MFNNFDNKEKTNTTPKRKTLREWIAAMKRVVSKPKTDHYYVCDGNLYLRYTIPEGEKNAGYNRWRRLTSLESLELYMKMRNYNQLPSAWLEEVSGTSATVDINTIDH